MTNVLAEIHEVILHIWFNLYALDEIERDTLTDLIVDWIEQRYSKNEAGKQASLVTGSKFMQQRTMWTTIAKHEFMHEFMFRYCPSHCSLLHKFTSGYLNDACFGFIFDAKTGTLLLYPVYYETSGHTQPGCGFGSCQKALKSQNFSQLSVVWS